MEEKKANPYGIVLDGRMDEAVWETAETHSGFVTLSPTGGVPAPVDTEFKVLTFPDRIFIGVKCLEPTGMEDVLASRYRKNSYTGHAIELFMSPIGNYYEFYQFVVTINNDDMTKYYSEGGNISPDYYLPEWYHAVHLAEDHWSIEVEIPLTAFYWSYQEKWSTKWLFNVARDRVVGAKTQYSTWSPLKFRFRESTNFNSLDGFPMRPAQDDVRIVSAVTDMNEETADGYKGTMTVRTDTVFPETFTFSSDHGESLQITLESGSNQFDVPCYFDKQGRTKTMLCLTRDADGKEFKRFYPVLAKFEPIALKLTQPEYRNNFYPGQDYTKIVGTVKTMGDATLTLEGPGIEKTTITPNADGSFQFDTPNFQEGEAWLTVNCGVFEQKRKIRRLADTGRAMVWISGGNLIVNGKPTLRRNMYGCFYRIGEAFKRRYLQEDLHETLLFRDPMVQLQPNVLLKGSEGANGEATKDQKPSEEMYQAMDRLIEANKDRDFAYYYISDEPECRSLSSVYLKHMYDYMSDKDPYHVILASSRSAGSLVEIADWFETHPYICPYNFADGRRVYLRAMNTLGNFVDSVVKLNRPDKCIGFLPTCYGGGGDGITGGDSITFDEYICHTWAAMIHGGKSLWPYASHDLNDRPVLLESTRYVFSSFEALEEIVLLGKRTRLYRTDDAECVLYEHGDEKMFVLVNFNQTAQTVTVDGLSGTWHEFRHNREISGNTFQLKPLEVIVGTNTVKDAGLPTYAETAAIIADLENKRKTRGSLLFNKHLKIKVTASGTKHLTTRKLFDGMPDNLAGWILEAENNFIELDLSKVKETFSKVVVGGWKIEGMKLLVKVGEEWTEPAAADVKIEEFSKTIILANAVTPSAMRLEFGGKAGEIYEIEVF